MKNRRNHVHAADPQLGSSLQGYGLRRLIEGLATTSPVSFVDYRPGPVLVKDPAAADRLQGRSGDLEGARSTTRSTPGSLDRLRFLNHKRAYGARYFPLLGISPSPNLDLDLDVQVIGSDEVFNCVQSNTNVGYSRDLFGHGSPANKVISYAGSFGNTTLDKIDSSGIRADLERDFARFSAISVRDRRELRAHRRTAHRTAAEVHVDPVLAYDFMTLESRIPGAPARGQVRHRLRLRRRRLDQRRERPPARTPAASARRSSASAASRSAATGSSTATRSSCWPTSATPRRSSPTPSTGRSSR